jgi:hypothetical protein
MKLLKNENSKSYNEPIFRISSYGRKQKIKVHMPEIVCAKKINTLEIKILLLK